MVVGNGEVKVRRETKGRKGKGVTLIDGLALNASELKILAKTLKQACSTGGAVKNGVIELQGEHREKVVLLLKNKGITARLSGG